MREWEFHIEHILRAIETKMVMKGIIDWNNAESISSIDYDNGVFEIHPYDWSDNPTRDYNFKWRDIEVRWYKYLGRGMEINRDISKSEMLQLLDECINSV
ncbi:hypothetical protein DRO54_04140 [Candidatus Bathyarchaeota archaeon]|nr:MAG: hypothetical protein DRO54_04140 [Candidatus Bathyarchaeota archaeon]